MHRVLLLAGAFFIFFEPAAAVRSAGSAPARQAAVQALLIQRYQGPAAIVSLAGKRLAVPARVRASPLGLSPDARLIVVPSEDAVRVGPVRGGSLKTVLRGNCRRCIYGTDPSFAWSPDSRRLAAAANLQRGPTLLKIFDTNGRRLQEFTLPGTNPETRDRAYHHLISWSPNGSRLLLSRSNGYGTRAVVVLEIETGRLRTLAQFSACDTPHPVWSPNGRYVAVTSRATQDCLDLFAIFDAATARPIIERSWDKGLGAGGTVWAPDSRSVFGSGSRYSKTGQVTTGIDRIDFSGRRSNVVGSTAGWLIPWVALPTGLVYTADSHTGHDIVYLHSFVTGRRQLLLREAPGSPIRTLMPLTHVP